MLFPLGTLLWLFLIVGLVLFFIRRRTKKAHSLQERDWYRRFTLSQEDAVSQLFLLLSVLFLGTTLLAFNRDLGDPLSWRTIFLISSVTGLAGAYTFKAVYLLPYGLIGTAGWWGIQAERWMAGKNLKDAAVLSGLALIALIFYVLGHWHGKMQKSKRFALVYLALGIFFITGYLFFLSTQAGLRALEDMTRGGPVLKSWQLSLSLLLFAASLAGLSLHAASKKIISGFEAVALILLALLFAAMTLLPEQKLFLGSRFSAIGELSRAGILWAFVLNLAVFLELIGLVFSGYLWREEWLINLGAFLLFLLIIVKYFDWFFTFLDKSVAFIGAGILLFVVGWFMERGRRYMISNMKAESPRPS